MKYDLIIVGSGAAGLSAALYATRYRLKTLVVEGEFGGETATAGSIENYPGVLPVDGYDLMKTMKKQAEGAGAVLQAGWVREVRPHDTGFLALTDKGEYETRTLLLATGSRRRHLGLPREEELTGKGVHYCWTCDGPLYGSRVVAMVGGGDSSVKGVNFLGSYARKIYLIMRESEAHAEPVNMERMRQLGEKVEVLTNTEVEELVGKERLEKLVLSRVYKGVQELVVDALFVEIGFDPDPTFAAQLGLERDEKNFLKGGLRGETNIPGVFVAGDATSFFGSFKQDITASALGAVAATGVYEYLQGQEKR